MMTSLAKNSAARLRDAAITLLYPRQCRVCGLSVESCNGGVACINCWQEFDEQHQSDQLCEKCGLVIRTISPFQSARQRTCGKCDDLAFVLARSCGIYEGALRESVLQLKRYPYLSASLRQRVVKTFSEIQSRYPVESVIPVPLAPGRQQERGFNQAEMLARVLTDQTGLYLDTFSLLRCRETPRHRAGMDGLARVKSLEKAFAVRAPRLIEARHLLLVDDVMTSGATVNEIAKVLLTSGANSVCVLTLARAKYLH
jgi:ComF family protein